MYLSPSSHFVTLNFGWRNTNPSSHLESVKVHLNNPSESYKVYLSRVASNKVQQLYLIHCNEMKLYPSLELTLENLRGLRLYTGKSKEPLDIEWPESIQPGQTYSLIVNTDSPVHKACITADLTQSTETEKLDVQTLRKTAFHIIHAILLPLMEEMEWEFLSKHGSIGIPESDENSFASDAIEKEIALFSPQELEGFLRQALALHFSKQEGDARKIRSVNYSISKMCLHFLGKAKLENILRTLLLHHANDKPLPYVKEMIEKLANRFYLLLCIQYPLYPVYEETTH